MKIKKNKKEKSTPENVQSIREKKKNYLRTLTKYKLRQFAKTRVPKFSNTLLFSPPHTVIVAYYTINTSADIYEGK